MKHLILTILALLTLSAPTLAGDKGKESAYDRVMRTGVLMCAYIVYPPETIKDPNTGKLSGTVVDTMEKIGEQLGIKIEWTEEVGFTNMFEGILSGRHDALCSGLYENPQRAKAVLFTIPTNYGVTYAFSRADDTRFDRNLSAINDPAVKIAVIDGEIAQSIAQQSYPYAKIVALPQLSDISMVLETIATGKADVAFLQKAPAEGFIAHNPNKIKIVGTEPVRAFPAPPIALHPDEIKLKLLLDSTIRSLLLDGSIEKILRTYDPSLESYDLVAKPYDVPAQ